MSKSSAPTGDMVAELQATIGQLQATILDLRKTISEQAIVIERLRRENAELKERLNKNSRNSSKPPSSDGFAKPTPTSLRKKSGKKPGAQAGHIGHGFSLTAPINGTVIHRPEQCADCQHSDKCVSCGRSAPHDVIDVEISTKVTRHHTEKYSCPLRDGKIISGVFPKGVTGKTQYGDGIRALAIALSTAGMVSIERTHQILQGLLGVPISTGTVAEMLSQFGSTVAPAVQEIKKALLASPVVNCDETGVRVNGSICWVHTACNGQYTYLSLQPKRGQEGMKGAGFLPSYKGIAIHDCLRSYWSFPELEHGLCGAHLLRELQGITDNVADAVWAKSMQKLLREMNQCRNEAVSNGRTELAQDKIEGFHKRYSIILGKARQKNPVSRPPKGRCKKGRQRALIDRLIQYKSDVLRFLSNLLVPFTNNLAEQSIRMMKVKMKVIGCFRTFCGGDNFVNVMSYLHTAMKHKIPAYTAILNALVGDATATIFA